MIKGKSGETCNITIKDVPIEIKEILDTLGLDLGAELNLSLKDDVNKKRASVLSYLAVNGYVDIYGLKNLEKRGVIVEKDSPSTGFNGVAPPEL